MLTRDVSKNVLENNLCSKSMGNHFLSIWRTFGLSLTWYTSTKNNSSTFFIQSTTFYNRKLMNIGQISVLKQKFITVSQTLFHGDCQGWLLRGFRCGLNLIWKDQIANLADLQWWRLIQIFARKYYQCQKYFAPIKGTFRNYVCTKGEGGVN